MTTTPDCIQILTAAYPHSPFPKETFALYVEMLKDLDPELLMAAVKHFITTNTANFAPNVAQLRATVAEIMAMNSGLPSSAEAWGIAFDAMRQAKFKEVPDFQHPAIKQAIDAMGGWQLVGMSKNSVADRAHFDRAYTQIVARGTRQTVTLPQIAALVQQLAIGAGNE